MPMGLATIIGGMSTTIGTSTNLLVVGIAQRPRDNTTFTMFEWVLPVAIVGGIGIAFLWLVAPRHAAGSRAANGRHDAAHLQCTAARQGGRLRGRQDPVPKCLPKTDGSLRIRQDPAFSESLFLAKLPSGHDPAR